MKFGRLVVVTALCVMCSAFNAYAGWEQQPDTKWKYFANNVYLTGWQNIDDDWYYFLEDKTCVQNKFWNVDGKWYYFDDKGIMADKDMRIKSIPVSISDNGECALNVNKGYQKNTQRDETIVQQGEIILNDIISRIDRSKSIVEQVNQVAIEVANMFDYVKVIKYPVIVDTYSVLQSKSTVCAGYCNVTQAILERLGIYSEIVEDETKFHCWIYFQDGNKGYYCDPTWYDTAGNNVEFLSKEISEFREYQREVMIKTGKYPLVEGQVQFKK